MSRKGAGVGLAGLTRWGRELGHLPADAADGDVMGEDAEEALEEVVEGGEPVHPGLPEVGECDVGDDDAAEGDDEGEEAGDEEGGEELVGGEGGDELAEADVVKLEDHEQHPGVAGAEGVAGEPYAPVPSCVSGGRQLDLG